MLEMILVSQSPRRREILEKAGFLFSVDTAKVSELLEKNLNLEDAICRIARQKSQAYLKQHNYLEKKEILVVSADTMVVLNRKTFGKPDDSLVAADHLRQLSGKTHSVITGIYLLNLRSGEDISVADTTLVQFRSLGDQEIQDYIATGEPMDKAGSYAIQGQGRNFVKAYQGSYHNVVGFPLELFEKTLFEKNWPVKKK